MNYYQENENRVLEALQSGREGLSGKQAQERLERHGPNKLQEAPKDSLFLRFLKQMNDPMTMILIAAAVLSGITSFYSGESFADVIIIMAVVLINAGLGVYQEGRAEKAIEEHRAILEAICDKDPQEAERLTVAHISNAKENLMSRFGLDDIQAQAILDMRLKALQGLDREKLEGEYKELEERIAYFNRVLSDESLVRQILKEELTAIAEKFGDDRKTEIQDVEDEIDIEDLIEEEQCVFTLTEAGYIKRTPVSEYTAQSKGGMGKKGITTREEDTVVDVFTASTHDHILFFTDTGKVYRKKGYQIPESGKTAKGTNLINILQIEQGERVQAMLHYRETGEEQLYLMMVTRNGTVKRLPVEALKNLRNNGIRALTMDEGDQLVSVRETDGSQKILIATHDGMAVVFDENDVRPMGRSAMGVRGIRLREGDYVVGAARAREGKSVLTITEKGYGKRTPVEEYRITNRGGLGIKNYQITDKTGKIVGVKVVDGTEDLLLMTQSGILIRTPVENIKETANRATQGVIVMRFKEEGDQVISMALAEHEDTEDVSAEAEISTEISANEENSTTET